MSFNFKYDLYSKTSGIPIGTKFGKSIGLDYSHIVVGCPEYNNGIYTKAGCICLFSQDGFNNWEYTGKITPSFLFSNGNFGSKLAIKNDYVVTTARIGQSSYRLFLFKIMPNNTWVQLSMKSIPTMGTVAITDNYVIVGFASANSNKGIAYIYNIENELLSSVQVIAGTNLNANFGHSLAISEDYAIIGAPGEEGVGAVYIYKKNYNGDGKWGLLQKQIPFSGKQQDNFGCSLSMFDDYLIVGSDGRESMDGQKLSGSIHLFKHNSERWHFVNEQNMNSLTVSDSANFGGAVFANDYYIASGSKTKGIVEIFSKNRNWGYLTNFPSGETVSNYFGSDISIYKETVIVSSEDNVYLYRNEPSHLRLGQEFPVDSNFVPSKTSLYLKKVGNNIDNAWIVNRTKAASIDATNFKSLVKQNNKVVFDDSISGYSGNGYMICAPYEYLAEPQSGILSYPIKTNEPGVYYLHLRLLIKENYTTTVSTSIDNKEIGSETEPYSGQDSWAWHTYKFVIPDTNIHLINISLSSAFAAIDKIIIDSSSADPIGYGQDFSESPYITMHLRLFDSSPYSTPDLPLFIYDYKTTLEDITRDDWYNFNIRVLDSTIGYTVPEDFPGSYFIVVSSTGTTNKNYILWEFDEVDEYSATYYSSIKV